MLNRYKTLGFKVSGLIDQLGSKAFTYSIKNCGDLGLTVRFKGVHFQYVRYFFFVEGSKLSSVKKLLNVWVRMRARKSDVRRADELPRNKNCDS